MSRVPMIGQPLVERQHFCEHNKIPQEVRTKIYQNPAIRLKEMSRLRKLGELEYRLCRDCNEHVCACLWSKYGQKPIRDEQTNQREYAQGKGWNFRNQLLSKFRGSYNRCKCNLATSTKGNNLIKCKDSVVWLLRPTKSMRESETNILVRPKSHQCAPRDYQAPPSLQPCKYRRDTESGVPDRTMKYNWKTRFEKKDVDETVAIAKGTKEYFNERKKRLHYGKLSDKITPKMPLIESQLEKALLQQKRICKNYGNQTDIEDPFISYTKIMRKNSLDKKQLQTGKVKTADNFQPEDFFEEILAMQSSVNMIPSPIERPIQCDSGNWKLNMECIDHAQDPNYDNAMFEMASKHDDDDVNSVNEEEEKILYRKSQTGDSSDYMWLKKTSTNLKLPSQIEERIQTSTQTSSISFKNGQRSNSSLAVNWTGSAKRLNDFEMSESGQQKKLHFAISEIEEKIDDVASLPKIEEESLSDDEEIVKKSKTPITHSKKQRKVKKYKHMRPKRRSSTSSEPSNQSVDDVEGVDGEKNVENNSIDKIEEETSEKLEEEPVIVKINRRVLNVSDNQLIRRPLKKSYKLPKRGSKSENNTCIGHSDVSLTPDDCESFRISYFVPVKYEKQVFSNYFN